MPQGRAVLAKLTFGLVKSRTDEETLERHRLSERMRAKAVQLRARRGAKHGPVAQPPGGPFAP